VYEARSIDFDLVYAAAEEVARSLGIMKGEQNEKGIIS
jgi:hypothetical protein